MIFKEKYENQLIPLRKNHYHCQFIKLTTPKLFCNRNLAFSLVIMLKSLASWSHPSRQQMPLHLKGATSISFPNVYRTPQRGEYQKIRQFLALPISVHPYTGGPWTKNLTLVYSKENTVSRGNFSDNITLCRTWTQTYDLQLLNLQMVGWLGFMAYNLCRLLTPNPFLCK